MAHAFDIGGALLPSLPQLVGSPADDARAIRGDWQAALRGLERHGEKV